MLFKDGTRYKLNDEEIKELNQELKMPIRLIYPKELMVWDAHNQDFIRPEGVSLQLREVVKTDKGTESWIYADNTYVDPAGKTKYTPPRIDFGGMLTFDKNDIELIWFLWNKSGLCGNNKIAQAKMARRNYFVFEDLVKDAKVKVAAKMQMIKLGKYLYDDESMLSTKTVSQIAKAMFISGVDGMEDNQIRIAIENTVNAGGAETIKLFLELAQNPAKTAGIKSMIQNALDLKVIKWDGKKKTWYWKEEDESSIPVEICSLPGGIDNKQGLIEFLIPNQELQGRMNRLIDLAKKAVDMDESDKE